MAADDISSLAVLQVSFPPVRRLSGLWRRPGGAHSAARVVVGGTAVDVGHFFVQRTLIVRVLALLHLFLRKASGLVPCTKLMRKKK